MARSTELLNNLSRASSFAGTADALLRTSVNRERQRTASILESIDRTRASAEEGNFFGAIANAGRTLGAIANFVGFGPKAVGPIEDLPISQVASQNTELRFVKTKAELTAERDAALSRVPEENLSIGNLDFDSLSLLPGRLAPDSDRLQNRYTRTRVYSSTEGRDAVNDFAGKVFPFKIQNTALVGQNTNTSERFVAYINNLVESVSPTWAAKSYLGRAEDVQVYGGASRTLTFGFTLFATSDRMTDELELEQELPGYQIPTSNFQNNSIQTAEDVLMDNSIGKRDMWRKLNFLSSLAYPAYDEEGRYDKAPYGRFTLGNLYRDQLFVATSFSYSYEPLVWDINDPDNITPMVISVTLSMTLLGDSSPGILSGGTLGSTREDGSIQYYTRAGLEPNKGNGNGA